MATIKKQGSGYKITVSMGYDLNGKQKRQHMTWIPDPGMTARQTEKELNRQAILFEEKCKAQQVYGGNMKLADFAEHWFSAYAEKNLKPRTVDGYRYLLKRTNEALGHIRLDQLQPRHLLSFYENLDEDGIREDTTYTTTGDFKAILKERQLRREDFAQAAGISLSTVDALAQRKNVSAATAEKASKALGEPIKKNFSPVSRGKLSGKTLLHYHRFLSCMLQTAVQWQYIAGNPCDRVKPPRANKKETSYLDEAQATKLIQALSGEPEQYQTIILLLLHTGLRRGELCGLEWQDIDFDKGTLSVQRNSLYLPGVGVFEGTPKTNSSVRTIKLPASCLPLLKHHRAWQSEQRLKVGDLWQDTGKLFTTWNGSPIHPDTLTNWFTDFVRRHDLPHVTIHGLRHTNATLLIAAGTNLRTVSSRLGHAQASTTANIYAHAIQSADAAAAEVLDDILTPKAAKKKAVNTK